MVKFLKNIPNIWKFFGIVCLLYVFCGLVHFDLFLDCLQRFWFLFKNIMGSMVLVFIFMYIFNIFITEKFIRKHLQKEIGFRQYFIVAVIGILSTGPLYLWYAHLSRMREHGMNNGLISLFLYNRAIKLPLIPLMIYYFSFKVTIVVSVLIFLFSFLNAFLLQYFLTPSSHENSHRING